MLTLTTLKATGMMLTLPIINSIANKFGTQSTGAKIAIVVVGVIGILRGIAPLLHKQFKRSIYAINKNNSNCY